MLRMPLLVVGLLLVLAACGPGSASPEASPGSSTVVPIVVPAELCAAVPDDVYPGFRRIPNGVPSQGGGDDVGALCTMLAQPLIAGTLGSATILQPGDASSAISGLRRLCGFYAKPGAEVSLPAGYQDGCAYVIEGSVDVVVLTADNNLLQVSFMGDRPPGTLMRWALETLSAMAALVDA